MLAITPQTVMIKAAIGSETVILPGWARADVTLGWRPTCSCNASDPIPATVLDPFLGSGTTALVADRLGRNCIGIELRESYAAMARRRCEDDAGLFAEVAAECSRPAI